MITTNVVPMQSQFSKTHTRSRNAECKTKKSVIEPQPFDHIRLGHALWVGNPASERLGREEQVWGYVIVVHTTPTRIVVHTLRASGKMKEQTWYRDGSQMGGYGHSLLRVATQPEIVEWEMARAEERRVREVEEQKQKAEHEALQSLMPEGIRVLSNDEGGYMLTGLTLQQVDVAGAALKAIVK